MAACADTAYGNAAPALQRGTGNPQSAIRNPQFFTTRLVHALTGRRALLWLVAALLVIGAAGAVSAQGGSAAIAVPKVSLGLESSKNPKDVAVTLQVLMLMTVLTLAPSLLIMTTAFTRIVIVLSILRSALGLPQVPPNQVLVGLALFMTFFVMRPTFEQINDNALQPYMNSRITFQQGMDAAVNPLRTFMIHQTYRKDLAFFVGMAKLKQAPKTEADLPITVVAPAFITSELKTAFIMGFYIYLPFLIIDIVVASTLMSMGMMMVPPTLIALPAKLLLFVMADGWMLLLGSLAKGFKT